MRQSRQQLSRRICSNLFAQARGHFGNLAACGRCPLESYVQFRVQWNRKLGDRGEQDPEQKRARMKHIFLIRPQPFVTIRHFVHPVQHILFWQTCSNKWIYLYWRNVASSALTVGLLDLVEISSLWSRKRSLMRRNSASLSLSLFIGPRYTWSPTYGSLTDVVET